MADTLDGVYGSLYPFESATVGPQDDGTYSTPWVASKPQPVDVGGGVPGNYGDSVLNLFKYGVDAWAANKQMQNLLDYRRYEATGGGVYQQGRGASVVATRQAGSNTGLILLAGAALVAFLVLKK